MNAYSAELHSCLLPGSHVLRNVNAQDSQRAFELCTEKVRHPKQEHFLLTILLVNNRILMIEVIECLSDLEGVFGYLLRPTRYHGPLDRRIGFGRRQQHLPEVFRL